MTKFSKRHRYQFLRLCDSGGREYSDKSNLENPVCL